MIEDAQVEHDERLVPRVPRARVIVGGQVATGVIDVRVMSTNYYSADWFHVSLTYTGDQTPPVAYWSSVEGCEVDIQCRLRPQEVYRSLIEGYVDSVVIDPIYRIVRIEGRDHSASLLSTCSRTAYANLSAGEIVSLVAINRGLIPNVYPTADLIGRFYGSGNDEMLIGQYSNNMTDWDLIVQLARREAFDVYVVGKTLYFGPPGGAAKKMFSVTPEDVTDLRLERSLVRPTDVAVSVRSWNSQLQQALGTGLAGMPGGWAPNAVDAGRSSASTTMVMAPNLRPDDIVRINRMISQELIQHRRTIELEMPGELDMNPRCGISLSGTGTVFDQYYDIESVDRLFGPVSGYVQRVRARQSGNTNSAIPIIL